jgi:hypothetical protein
MKNTFASQYNCRPCRGIRSYTVNQFGTTSIYTLNLAHLTSSFVWPVQLSLLHILLFKVLIRKYFTQGKCDFMKFLFILSGKIKILTLYTRDSFFSEFVCFLQSTGLLDIRYKLLIFVFAKCKIFAEISH